MVGPDGFEPSTARLSGEYSTPELRAIWGDRWDLNPQRSASQADGLPLSYDHHVAGIPGLEPEMKLPKSFVLPLHHIPWSE